MQDYKNWTIKVELQTKNAQQMVGAPFCWITLWAYSAPWSMCFHVCIKHSWGLQALSCIFWLCSSWVCFWLWQDKCRCNQQWLLQSRLGKTSTLYGSHCCWKSEYYLHTNYEFYQSTFGIFTGVGWSKPHGPHHIIYRCVTFSSLQTMELDFNEESNLHWTCCGDWENCSSAILWPDSSCDHCQTTTVFACTNTWDIQLAS